MALDKQELKDRLVQAFSNPKNFNNIHTVAEAIADAVHDYVKGGDVTGVCPSGGGTLSNGKVI